ncbi:ADP-ribosylglycohydrolase family protein [Candidatus Sumerlaeota bacterium]|nr:ADP-ribosylglycohydrolase family protein [Candidatus Sumerlaeota bacterium]
MASIGTSMRDKVFGAYLGAAVGDALGGPAQAMHAERIRSSFGGVNEMLAYRKPPGFLDIGSPGYAMHDAPGSVTGETLIRSQIARFVIDHPHSRSVPEFLHFLTHHGDLKIWPPQMAEVIERALRERLPPEVASRAIAPGGGLGWWTAIGVANAGRPDRAAEEVIRLSALWKRPLEQDLLAAVQAGVAHALTPKATPDSVVEAGRSVVRPLARRLIDRAVALARLAPRGDIAALCDRLYKAALVTAAPDGADGELPTPAPPPPSDAPTASPLFAEQAPLAFAALIFGDGRSRLTLTAAASLGRDAKAIGSAVGSLIGGLVGRSRLPREWVGTVIGANHDDVDLVQQANDLANLLEPEVQY